MRYRRSWMQWSVGMVLGAAALGAAAPATADVRVGGHGPRIEVPGRRPVGTEGRPVFVVVDGLAEFGDLQDVRNAPPLQIQVEGDVRIFVQPDGTLRIVLGGGDEEEAE